MRNPWKIVAGVSGFIAVAMGAVGTHIVKDVHSASLVEKASFYQLVFSVLLLWLANTIDTSSRIARGFFALGILLFCGSLYVKSFTGWENATTLAPLGGICFMLGWLALALLK